MPADNPLLPFLEHQGVLILDGGLATELEARGADLDDPLWSARLLIENPGLIRQVHHDYYAAGADVAVTASYQASFSGLARRGLSRKEAAELMLASVRLADEARAAFWSDAVNRAGRLRPLVAASIGPYGAHLHDGSEYRGDYGVEREALMAFHRERMAVLADAGADLFACETIPSRLEAQVLIELFEQFPGVQGWLSFSCRDGAHICDGAPFRDCATLTHGSSRILAVGFNCTPPQYAESLVRVAVAVTDKPVVVYPNSGERYQVEGNHWLPGAGVEDFVASARRWHDAGARLIGGCCRTGPHEIAGIARTLRKVDYIAAKAPFADRAAHSSRGPELPMARRTRSQRKGGILQSECAVGICGLGERMGHVAHYFSSVEPRFRVVAHADPDPRGRAYLEERGMAAGTSHASLEQMLERESLDLLMVGSPNFMHLRHIEMGLSQGVRVFSEKPVVIDEAQTLSLLRALGHCGHDRVLVGLVLRYSALYQDFTRLHRDGVTGDIVSMEGCEHLGPAHGAFLMRDWRRYERNTGGYMLEKCCHDLDLYQGLVRSRPRRVASFGGRGTFIPRHRQLEQAAVYHQWPAGWAGSKQVFESDGDIVDFQTAIVEYESGVSLAFHTNIHSAERSRRICAIGSNGRIEGDFERHYLRAHDARTQRCVFERSYGYDAGAGHYGAEVRMAVDVCRHLFEGAPLPVTSIDALQAGLTAIKIDEARKCGTVVSLEESWLAFDRALGDPATAPAPSRRPR